MLEYVLLDTVEKLSRPKFRAHRKTLAEFIGMSRGGLIKAINRLVEKGLLTRVNDKEIGVTQKWIEETISSVNKVDTGVNKVDTYCQQSVQPTIDRTNKLEINTKNIQKEFDEFWKEYPKKVMKGNAEKAFNKIRKTTSFNDLMAGLKTSPQLKNPIIQYIPNAQAWINGKGWLDVETADTSTTYAGYTIAQIEAAVEKERTSPHTDNLNIIMAAASEGWSPK